MREYEILLGDESSQTFKAIRQNPDTKGNKKPAKPEGEVAIKPGIKNNPPEACGLNPQSFSKLMPLKYDGELTPEMISNLNLLTKYAEALSPVKDIQVPPDEPKFEISEFISQWRQMTDCLEKLESQHHSPRTDKPLALPDEKILDMLRIMSHDIRSPLISMMAILKLLIQGFYGNMDPGVHHKLNELFSKVTTLIGISEEYLSRTFSLNDDLDMERESLDLKQDIIDPVMEELVSEFEDRHIQFDCRMGIIPPDKIPINASRIWLKAVFRNLFRNAIKYCKKGGTIVLGLEEHGTYYKLNVYNSGKPIPEECQRKLFIKYARMGIDHGGDTDSLGLGLYLIKKIILKHLGQIWYEAKEDGSNFVFTLPRG